MKSGTLRWLACLIAVVSVGLLAACGDDGDEKATGSEPAATVEETAEATGETEEAEFASELPQGDNPVGEAAGATIGFVSACQNCEAMGRLSAALEEAAEAAGMKVRIYDTKGNPADAAKGVETLLQAGADVIALGALPPQVVGNSARLARQKRVPIFGLNTGVPSSAAEGITAFNIDENLGEAQAALVERMIADVGPDAEILYIYDKVLPVGVEYDKGLRSALGDVKILDSAQHDLTKITQQGFDTMQTWLAKYPNVDAVLCAYDAGCLGAYQAIQAAGLDIPVYSGNGNLENLDLIRGGARYVTNALALELGAWLGVDRAITLLNGGQVDDPPPVRDLIIDNENVPETGVYDGTQLYGDYRAHLRERWGVN